MTSPIARRIAGTATLIMALAVATIGFNVRFSQPAASTEFTIEAPEAGIGMRPGVDIKSRGVPVGRVIRVVLDEQGRPVITGLLDPGVQIPRDGLEVNISPKTFFGEKQVELNYPLDQYGQAPFVGDGDVLQLSGALTEVEDVLQTLQPLLQGIDEDDLATLFDAAAALEGEGPRIARNLEVTAEVARFGASISEDALRNARILTSLADQLERGADDFDRLNRQLPGAVAVLAERQQEIDTNLEALSSFALTTAAWIDVERDRFDRVLESGDVVGAFLERNVQSIPSIVEGIRMFAEAQALQDPRVELDDGTVYVPFKVFFNPEDLEAILGPLAEPLTAGGG